MHYEELADTLGLDLHGRINYHDALERTTMLLVQEAQQGTCPHTLRRVLDLLPAAHTFQQFDPLERQRLRSVSVTETKATLLYDSLLRRVHVGKLTNRIELNPDQTEVLNAVFQFPGEPFFSGDIAEILYGTTKGRCMTLATTRIQDLAQTIEKPDQFFFITDIESYLFGDPDNFWKSRITIPDRRRIYQTKQKPIVI